MGTVIHYMVFGRDGRTESRVKVFKYDPSDAVLERALSKIENHPNFYKVETFEDYDAYRKRLGT